MFYCTASGKKLDQFCFPPLTAFWSLIGEFLLKYTLLIVHRNIRVVTRPHIYCGILRVIAEHLTFSKTRLFSPGPEQFKPKRVARRHGRRPATDDSGTSN